MTALPPLLVGAVHETATEALPLTPVTPVGGPGTPATGVTGLDAVEAAPVPMALVAFTWKVYGVPLVRPLTVQVVAGAVAVQPALVGDEVTV